jgi:hypothetical protein
LIVAGRPTVRVGLRRDVEVLQEGSSQNPFQIVR